MNMNKVLYIEDNESAGYLMKVLLSNSGYQVLLAENGILGIEMAKMHHPDIIIVDIQLPEIDGLTVAKILRQDNELKFIPIIAVTAFAMLGDKEKILQSGINGYISKPINPESFVREMQEIILNIKE